MPEEFLRLIGLDEAVGRLLEAVPGPTSHEDVPLGGARGRVLARDVVSPVDLPGFDRSSMDGFAVRASDTYGAGEGLPAYLEVVGEVPMGRAPGVTVGRGEAAGISTGGVIPPGADAVVMVEDTETAGTTIEVKRAVAPGDNVIAANEDVSRGAVLLGAGGVMGPHHLGALAGLGITTVPVFPVPLVGIISTGDELVAPDETPGPGQVRDINTVALAASVSGAGCRAREYGIIADDPGRLLDVSRRAVSECDALLLSGGSSAGVRDLTLEVISQLGPPGVLAHGIYLKPGKPTLIAACGGTPVFGLPGNPASALAVFREVVSPVLSHLKGEAGGPRVARVVRAVLERSVASATGRVELLPVELRVEGDELFASPVMGRSNLIGTLARAVGNVRIPEGTEGLERGRIVDVELLE